MKQILVLGAGKIGRMVVFLLQTCGDYRVTVMDSHQHSLDETLALAPGSRALTGAFDDAKAIDAALDGA
ncbi:MAG: saccharopine dehydrogenase NADP-binding domain-containing protein, partial [Phycisphaerae bacterium]|nr:saccharopine dehydrogenase NADP-binding domain-containing protein [Phycisphaerae bacterium]